MPVQTQDRLIAEFLGGKLWDSLQPNAQPVSEASDVVPNDRGGSDTKTIYTYADGSTAVSLTEIPREAPEGVSARGIDLCTLASGVGNFKFWGCRVHWETAITSIEFWVDGQTSTIGQANITFRGEGGWWCAACTPSGSTYWNVHRLTQTPSLPAQVAWVLPVTWIGGSGSGSGVLSVGVLVKETISSYQGT